MILEIRELVLYAVCIEHPDLEASAVERRHRREIFPQERVEGGVATDVVKKGTLPEGLGYQRERVHGSRDRHIEKPPLLLLDALDAVAENTQEHPVRVNQGVASLNCIQHDDRSLLKPLVPVCG